MTDDLIARARAGDGEAFRELTEPYRRELQVYCYRMLGSLQDAEDVLQDTLLGAWQGLDGFEGRASIRTWLYRIATNRCLNARRSASRRPAKEWDIAEYQPPEPTRIGEIVWLEPFPDALLEGVMDVPLGPEARYEQTESISLAFVTALQVLPPRQLAVLVLRDVLGFHANEVADMLDATIDSVNSLLKRARANLQRRLSADADREAAPAPDSPAERATVAEFVRAYEAGDLDALVALLTDDVFLSMPPLPLEYEGIDVATRFYATMIGSGRRFDLVPTRANGQPAFGAYLRAASGIRHGTGLLVLTLTGDRIGSVTRFDTSVLPWFGLPRSAPQPIVTRSVAQARVRLTGSRSLGRADVEGRSPRRIDGYVRRTPVLELGPGAFGLDARVTLKLELTQHTGSFKPRGAFNKLLASEVPDVGRHRGVRRELRARGRVRRAHARPPRRDLRAVQLAEGQGRRGSGRSAPRSRSSTGTTTRRSTRAAPEPRRAARWCMHAYDQPEIVAGQGTVGAELAEQVPDADTVLVAIGGGGLIGGIGAWYEGRTRVIGVEPETSTSMTLGDRGGRTGRRHLRRVRGGLARHQARRRDRVRDRLGARRARRPGLGRRDPRGPAAALAGGPDLRGAGRRGTRSPRCSPAPTSPNQASTWSWSYAARTATSRRSPARSETLRATIDLGAGGERRP